jgi:hypothetical protein
VVRRDQRVDSAIVQVTIDNQPPELKIIQPGAGQVLSISPRSAAVFEAQAGDDLALEQVEFYIDGQWVVTLSQPPFLFSWKLSPGRHTLLVRAIDLAGNESKESLDFEVKS